MSDIRAKAQKVANETGRTQYVWEHRDPLADPAAQHKFFSARPPLVDEYETILPQARDSTKEARS
jgi:hypothetical protein